MPVRGAQMSETHSLEDLRRPGTAAGSMTEQPVRKRRGLRIVLLSLAAAILLLGAAIAGVFGYQSIRPAGMPGPYAATAATVN